MFKPYTLKILNKISPQLVWWLYAKQCQKVLDNAYMILSFDCDTTEDMQVALDVNSRLRDIGITPVYAVPGEILQGGEKVYSKIYAAGAEFINHGGREHTYFDTEKGRHASCFFYDQQTKDDLRADILLGHKILQDILGITSQGWRTPHFGTFQQPIQLEFLYSILNELNYKFSSSTCPQMGYMHGPTFRSNNIIEIPVTGIFNEPFNIMDTWAFFAAPDRTKVANDYYNASENLRSFAVGKPLLINIYGDPSHIHDKPEFFAAMKNLVSVAKNINYTQYLGVVNDSIRDI